MAKKKIKAQIKLQIPAGKANPAPPVGPALGQHGLNIAEFCQKYNAATQSMMGDVIPVVINVYEDRTYDFTLKSPPASDLLKKAAGLEKGSQKPLTDKVGKVTRKQLLEIAEKKKNDLNTTDMEQAAKMIAGTARQMGIEIID
jgi:large subunit ribosomal protein L11